MLVRIGTRKSKLALTQTKIVIDSLKQHHQSLEFSIHEITTTGDKLYDQDLAIIGGKGLFLKEIEEQLIEGNIDIAVHSMKDVPAFLPPGLTIDCVCKREEPQDVFVSGKYESIQTLPSSAVIGTSSSRRRLQLLTLRPDIKTIPLRGNVPTRIEKVTAGKMDGCILALAGIKRLGLTAYIKQILPLSDFLPAVAQGAIGIERRANDNKMKALLEPLHSIDDYLCVTAERAYMQEMGGNCTIPIAAYATLANGVINMEVQYFELKSFKSFKAKLSGTATNPTELGRKAAAEIKRFCLVTG